MERGEGTEDHQGGGFSQCWKGEEVGPTASTRTAVLVAVAGTWLNCSPIRKTVVFSAIKKKIFLLFYRILVPSGEQVFLDQVLLFYELRERIFWTR